MSRNWQLVQLSFQLSCFTVFEDLFRIAHTWQSKYYHIWLGRNQHTDLKYTKMFLIWTSTCGSIQSRWSLIVSKSWIYPSGKGNPIENMFPIGQLHICIAWISFDLYQLASTWEDLLILITTSCNCKYIIIYI